MSKTLGQIARDAFLNSLDAEREVLPTAKTWDVAAEAVAQLCAEAIKSDMNSGFVFFNPSDQRSYRQGMIRAEDVVLALINGGEDA